MPTYLSVCYLAHIEGEISQDILIGTVALWTEATYLFSGLGDCSSSFEAERGSSPLLQCIFFEGNRLSVSSVQEGIMSAWW